MTLTRPYYTLFAPCCQIRKEIFHHGAEKRKGSGHDPQEDRRPQQQRVNLLGGASNHWARSRHWEIAPAVFHWQDAEGSPGKDAGRRCGGQPGHLSSPQQNDRGQWLDIWQRDYLGAVKVSTADIYRSNIKNHIKPGLGVVRLVDLHPHTVQGFINVLAGLSLTSVRLDI